MKSVIGAITRWGLVVALACATSAAYGQATRTWVSGVGDDANPCSRTAPCKTFPGAISKTAACGEIDVLDPGGFGTVTITKPITIDGLGPMASILAASTNGININIPAGDIAGCPSGAPHVVTLRNLSVNGAGSGLVGINVIAVDELHVENLNVFGFRAGSALGLYFHPNTAASVYVQNSTFTNNLNQGVSIWPSGGAMATASLKNVKLSQNGGGLLATDGSYVEVTDSVVAGNAGYGFQAAAVSGGSAKVHVERTIVSDNGVAGLRTDNAGALIRFAASNIVANNFGILGTGTTVSFGNNVLTGNSPGGDGNPTVTSPLR